jgi:maltose-binding protein MalE
MSESRADQEALLASVATVKSLLDEGYIPPELNGALTASLFRAGELAFVINGPWFKGDLEGLEAPWRVAPLPALKADGSAALSPYLGVEGVFISSHAQDKSGAWQLAQELASERAARAALERGVLVAHRAPYQAEASPALKAWRQAFERQLDHVEPLSNRPEMKRLWTPLKRMLSSSLLFGKDPQESLTEALRAIEELAR